MRKETIELYDKYKEFDNHVFSTMSVQELFNLRHEMLDLLNKFKENFVIFESRPDRNFFKK